MRDYWVARAALRGAVGGRLPDDGEATEPTLGVEAIMPAPAAAEMDHSQHGEKSNDPHAGHHMPKSADAADPHAGHAMPQDRSEPDPHAQHRQQAEPTKAEKAPEPDEEAEHTHDHGEQP